jgi:hypothetical protein
LRVEHVPEDEPRVFWLLPQSVQSWGLWFEVQTQWRSAGMEGIRTGLDYQAVEAFLRVRGYGHGKRKSIRRVLDDIRAMEVSAMTAWDKLREQKARSKRG